MGWSSGQKRRQSRLRVGAIFFHARQFLLCNIDNFDSGDGSVFISDERIDINVIVNVVILAFNAFRVFT